MTDANSRPVAIVTGASRGVGAAVAVLLAEKGWNMVLNCSRTLAQAEQVAERARALGAEVQVVQGDVGDDASCRELAATAEQQFGRIDGVVNNAGTTKFCNLANMEGLDAEDFLHIYRVNLIGPFQLIRAALPLLRKAPSGAVVNVSSIAGVAGIGSSVAYAASKGALNTMTRSLAIALGPVRVNALCPGFIQGDWLRQGLGDEAYQVALDNWKANNPLGTAATPEQVARGVWHLLAEAELVSGETLLLDSGAHLPSMPFRAPPAR